MSLILFTNAVCYSRIVAAQGCHYKGACHSGCGIALLVTHEDQGTVDVFFAKVIVRFAGGAWVVHFPEIMREKRITMWDSIFQDTI